MASASELISNTGNAGLSQGSNPDIGVVSTPEQQGYNKMQEVANKMMLQNHAFAVDMFNQKIADRDALLKALNDGQVESGKIDEVDKPAYDKAKKEQDDAFTNFAENGGVNNKEAYQNLIEKTTNLKNIATHLQGREIGIAQQKADLATEPVKAKQDERKAYLDRQLAKGSGSMIDPYQQSLEFDADKLISGIQKGTTSGSGIPANTTTSTVRTTHIAGKPDKVTTFQKTIPLTTKSKKGTQTTTVTDAQPVGNGVNVPRGTSDIVYRNGLPYNVTTQYVDFNKLKQNANDQYLDPKGEGTELQNQFYDKITDPNYLSHAEVGDTYDEMIKKANQYNAARGFVPQADGSMSDADLKAGAADVKKLTNALNIPPDPKTGKRAIAMSKPELAAYFALAHMGNYVTKSETLLGDEAKLGLQAEKVRGELKIKAAEAASKAKLRDAQIQKLHKATAGKSEAEQKMEFDKYWAANGVSVLSDKTGNIPYTNSRPVYVQSEKGDPKLLKPIGAKSIYDKYDKDGKPAADAKVVGYDGGYYKTEFYNKATGGVFTPEAIQAGFKGAQKKNPKLTEQEYLFNIADGGVTYRMIGDKGQAANIDDNGNNLRILDNKFKKKDQADPIFSDTDLFEQDNTP